MILSRTTGTDGKEFSFSFSTNVFGKNGGPQGIINGGLIKLTFKIPGHDPIEKTGSLVKSSLQGNEHYFYWTWEINVGAEDKELANQFLADRDVNYQTVGAFIFETGKDLRHDPSPGPIRLPGPVPILVQYIRSLVTMVDLLIDGNRFAGSYNAIGALSIYNLAFT